jgi:hypothetical protein
MDHGKVGFRGIGAIFSSLTIINLSGLSIFSFDIHGFGHINVTLSLENVIKM